MEQRFRVKARGNDREGGEREGGERERERGKKMILSLTVAAFFDSIAYVMGEDHSPGALCNFQAWWLTYFVHLLEQTAVGGVEMLFT
ncbi:hypothetical protein JZ751_007677 [Albula glossodonta]|uniref:Uncharacterized protein n=1 Tax=Albula glossodonta TaxID=121402 RepID=A0A8T2N732_9TELE|nr:hypothetical protein JZ751_007677 [Albula glossodonta]